MTLLFLLLKAVLAFMLAYLGGAFLRNVRGLCPENSAAALQRDRLLGLALYAVSAMAGTLAATRLATSLAAGGTWSVVALITFVIVWLGALRLGLRRNVSLASVRVVASAAVLAFTALVVAANGAVTGADVFLMLGALVWLGATLLSPRRNTG